jgi:cyclic pyranopterin phosphate synthase
MAIALGPESPPPLLADPQRRAIDYLRISVTDRCNYRCSYCIPQDGVGHVARADVLSFEEIVALARVFVALGVRRLRLTGGEPTVRRDLPTLARMLRALPGVDELSLSTNGHVLDELAEPLRAAGVDRLNVSLDSLDAERFRRITGRGDLARVRAGLEAARAVGFASVKLNTVAIKGFNDDELGAICDYAWRRGFVPRFIEEMPMAAGETYLPAALLTAAEIRAAIAAAHPGARVVADDGGPARGAGPARYHRLEAGADDDMGGRGASGSSRP